MKKCALLILSFVPIFMFAQKQDNIWILAGNSSNLVDDNGYIWGNTVLDFSSNDLNVYYDSVITLDTGGSNATICNEQGSILAYTNSMTVHNRFYEPIVGLDTIGFGDFWRNKVLLNFPNPGENWLVGYPFLQGVLFLPDPANKDHIYCLYPNVFLTDLAELIFNYNYALISYADSFSGKKIFKDVDFPSLENQKKLNNATINACRHANGKDWWLMTQSEFLEDYYVFLLDDTGIHAHSTYKTNFRSEISNNFTFNNFSPDGNYFAEGMSYFNENIDTAYQQTTLYEFNRCTGDFTFITRDTSMHYRLKPSVTFSPNSQYLYTASNLELYQYDLASPDIKESKQVVAEYDGYKFKYNENDPGQEIHISYLANGPDGKIYSIPAGNSRFLHTIEYPDEAGEDCHFAHRSINMPTSNFNSTPNFANYRLGPVDV